MRREFRYVVALGALLAAACSDGQLSPDHATGPAIAPSGPAVQFSLISPPTICPTIDESQRTVDQLLPQIFGPGNGRRGRAQGFSNNIAQARRNGNGELALTYMDSLVNYTLQNYYASNLIGQKSEDTQNRVLSFIYAMYCANSISPIPDLSGIFLAENAVLIRHNTPTTVVTAGADSAAVEVEQGEVPSTVFGTYVSVFRTNAPLPTSLDWYGVDGFKAGAFEFSANPPVTFTSPVLTGVCIKYDDAVVSANDLRLAHAVETGYTPVVPGNTVVTTAGGTIEVGAYADPSPLGLACDPLPPPTASRGLFGKLLHEFAQLFVPARAYAGVSGGSTGSQVVKFSPFAAVDIRLHGSASGPSSPQFIPVGSTETTAPVSVTVTTRKGGTPVDGIAVAFAPGGTFSSTPVTTNAGGTAASTWTIVAGANSGSATTSSLFTLAPGVSFSVTGVQLVTVGIATTSLPSATAGVAYSQALQASDGDGAYAWSLAGGSLPAGVSLSAAGVVSGTPNAVGTSTFTAQVTSAGATASKSFALTVGYPGTLGALAFQPPPSGTQCYALNVIMAPSVAVKVTSVTGVPLAGVRVDIVAITNNGAKVVTSQPFAISGADGLAVFNTLSINKTGAYRLIVSTSAPWPVTSVQSGKFNISPAC